jgi:hypothetical protein
MGLTPAQREVWHSTKTGVPAPSGDQTFEQAWAFAIWSFQHACAFEGVKVPREDDVAEELRELLR